ncbi:hypothetical protein CL655_04240, partial [bacterium]|nr:hypothetical protein [bacterium]
MEHKTYCIKPGYQARHEEAPHTALESGASYWHKSRIDLSKYYQYAVYQQAARIAARAAITRVADIGCG